ncbi:MAG TPA: hypothetical protein VK665_13350 [Candidatus Elarobacter sp.]|nr:hypothetical protein [Candidatus Elarobacter sp.]
MSNDVHGQGISANGEAEKCRARPVRRIFLREVIAMPVQPPSRGPVSAHPGTAVTPKQPEK